MAGGNGHSDSGKIPSVNIFSKGKVDEDKLQAVLESIKDVLVYSANSNEQINEKLDALIKGVGDFNKYVKDELEELENKIETKTEEIYIYVRPVKRLYRKLIWIAGIAIGFGLWITPILWDIIKVKLLK